VCFFKPITCHPVPRSPAHATPRRAIPTRARRARPQQALLPDQNEGAICRSLRLCHHSRGLAYTSIDVFAALEPLFDRLALRPVNDYVSIAAASGGPGCIRGGCCCSEPVEVRLSLPAPAGAEAAQLLEREVAAYVVKELPRALGGAAACFGQLRGAPCAAAAIEIAPAAEVAPRRRALM
jgi:hypothetical protein